MHLQRHNFNNELSVPWIRFHLIFILSVQICEFRLTKLSKIKKINPFPLTRPLDRDSYDKLSAQNPIKNATVKRLDTDYSPSDTYSVQSGFVFTLIDNF